MRETKRRASKEALFCIGSNCGNRKENVEKALFWLSGILKEFKHSTIYATPDCHGGQREYKNAVGAGLTELSVLELDMLCKNFELSQGRDSEARARGEVPVDVDIVVYDGEVMRKRDFGSEFFLIGYREI